MCRIIIEGGCTGQTPEWATELETRLTAHLDHITTRLGTIMALTDDLQAAVQDLVSEQGTVLTELDKLLQKANERGSVSDTDVQSAVDAIRSGVQQVNDRISQIEGPPAPEPVPTPDQG